MLENKYYDIPVDFIKLKGFTDINSFFDYMVKNEPDTLRKFENEKPKAFNINKNYGIIDVIN